ncbi:MAG: transcription antitermination factor NusB [Rhodospirillaceae bacterium]|jgi:transcription antitermination protein NusB|nr:transcription antitermination factor NusB [Rhodospirillaceae bacterium]
MTVPPPARSAGKPRQRATVRHRAARLAAVQALYQLEISDMSVGAVVDEFINHRLGTADPEASRGAKANEPLFKELVHGADIRKEDIQGHIVPSLSEGWTYDRLEIILRCILRLGTFELLVRFEAPAAVILSEYVHIADEFFSGSEPGVINGVLDRIARDLRPGELESHHDKSIRPTG